jgi:site-specific recombinase XerD
MAVQLRDSLMMLPHGVGRERWPDFKTTIPEVRHHEDSTLKEASAAFLASKEKNVAPKTYKNLKRSLGLFTEACSGMTLEQAVESGNLQLYRDTTASSSGFAASTAKAAVADVGTFVRWLYSVEHISKLPKIIELGNFSVSAGYAEPRIADEDIVRQMLTLSGVSRAFVLCGLNFAFTQRDIETIKDVDGKYLEHRRPKTEKHASVPTVKYLVWTETAEVLPLLASVNLSYESAVTKRLRADCKRAGIDYLPHKMLRKASATVLRNSDYSGLTDYFLGHSAGSMADRHYASVQQQRLDAAVDFLRKHWLG